MWLPQIVFCLVLTIDNVLCLTCLHCNGITQARQCRRVEECGAGEVCSMERVTNEFGEDVFNLGCRPSQNCQNVTTSSMCASCCSSNLCNSQGCGQIGYPNLRGPVCYSCKSPTAPGRCHDIDHCENGEYCAITGQVVFGEQVFTTHCASYHTCSMFGSPSSVIGKREMDTETRGVHERSHEIHICDTCCNSDLCNVNCSSSISLSTYPSFSSSTPFPVISTNPTTQWIISTGIPVIGATDCYDVQQLLPSAVTGTYTITTWDTNTTIDVFCDMDTDGGGWTVFQHRFDGSVDFYRNYSDYENGFGYPSGEFWMGLRYIKEMTDQSSSELRMDITCFDNTTAYERYNDFNLGTNSSHYLLNVGSVLTSDSMMQYNSLDYNNGHGFVTYDSPGDNSCARNYHGAFWYNNCFYVNPNGLYQAGDQDESMSMTDWDSYKSANTFKMMFRRV